MTALEFDYSVRKMSDKLKAFALSLTSSNEDANDLMQETYYRALNYRDKYESETNLKAWLYTIMRNIFINNYRRKSKFREIQDAQMYAMNTASQNQSLSTTSSITAKEIQKLVDKLDEDLRICFTLHYEGYKYKEIAEQLDIPIGTVKSRIHTSRKILSTQVNALYA